MSYPAKGKTNTLSGRRLKISFERLAKKMYKGKCLIDVNPLRPPCKLETTQTNKK